MAEAVTAAHSPPAQRALLFERTVERSLVHRRSIHEVFLTDLVGLEDDVFLVGAQLPVAHSFFLDQSERPARYGISLLIECCKQAFTYIAHLRYSVPREWTFLVTGVSAELSDARYLAVGERPAELVMSVRSDEAEVRGGQLRTLRASFALSLRGEHVGQVRAEGRYVTPEEYELIRAVDRDGPVPSSASLPETAPGVPVPPRLVGRRDPGNVVLVDGRRAHRGADARLGVPGRHPTVFDHPLDHYPGMALIEAAVQAALLAAGLEHEGLTAYPAALRGSFTRFVELDADVTVHARFLEPAADDPGSEAVLPVAVGFRQGGLEVAATDVVLKPAGVPAAGHRAGTR